MEYHVSHENSRLLCQSNKKINIYEGDITLVSTSSSPPESLKSDTVAELVPGASELLAPDLPG